MTADILIFNLLRRKKREWARDSKASLTQAEVDEANAVLADWKKGVTGAAGSPPAGPGLDATASTVSPATGHPAAPAGQMRASQAGIDLIHSFEQCKLTAYPDPGSSNGEPWTIGWGATGPGIKRGTVWTQAQADERFRQDIAGREKRLNETLAGIPTTQRQFDALLSLGYNIGMDALAGSTVMRRHKSGDHENAATAFGMWVKNDGKVMRGLVRRRAAEAELYRGK